MQDSRGQQSDAESLALEKDGTHKIAKPVPPERLRKKQNRDISKSSSDSDKVNEKKVEGSYREPTAEASDSVNVTEAAVRHVMRETEIECWKLDMMRIANKEGFSEEGVKISSKDNKIVVDGKPEKVAELCNVIVDLDNEIKHREIPISDDQNLIQFLKRPPVIQTISEMLSKKNINNHWVLNEKRPLIDLFVFGKGRLQEACEIMKKSFCYKMQMKSGTTLLHHLRRSKQWNIKIHKLTRDLENKVMYILNDSCCDVAITCTNDLKAKAVARLEEMERVLEKEIVFHLKDGKRMLLLKYPFETKHEKVTPKVLSDEKCIIFDGEGDVNSAKLDIKLIAAAFKHSEIEVQDKEILDFLQNASVERFINERLQQNNLIVHWEVNGGDGVIDVFMGNDEKLRFACSFIAKTYCKQEFHFSNNPEGFEQFNQKLKHILDKHGEKLHLTVVGGDFVRVVGTQDVLPKIANTYKECQVTTISMDFVLKERAMYEFIKKQSHSLMKIQETHSVVIEPCDDCCKFAMKGRKKNLDGARETLQVLCTQKSSIEVIPICLKRFSKFRNGDYESICEEFEKDCCIQPYEKPLEDVRFNEQGCEILVTNRQFEQDEQNKVAVFVPTEDIKDSHVDIRDETPLLAYCSSMHMKLDGGKDVQQLQQMFENLLVAVEERELWTLVIPIDDLKSYARQEKFTKLFLQSYCRFIQGKTRHITEIVIQVLDRKTWQTVRGAVSDYLLSRECSVDTTSRKDKLKQHDTEPYELVVVGRKDAVAKAKARLEEIFKQEDTEFALEARKPKKSSDTGVLKGDREENPASGRSEMKKTSSEIKSQYSKQSGDISHLDKLLDDVKVEIREKFIGKLPDKSVLKVLGLFKVRLEEKHGKCWLIGKLTDLEKAGEFLKTIIKSPIQLYQLKDVSRDVYDLVCSKFEEFKDRIIFDDNTGKVTILNMDKEVEACLDLYSKYQFEELLVKFKTASGVHRSIVFNDKKAAENLKVEKGEQYANVEFFISPKDAILKIAAPNYTILSTFKFALEVRTNRKQVRGRQGRTDVPIQELKYIESKEEREAEATHSYNTSDMRRYKTNQGLQIYVYKYDILKLKVDCIVNAANKEMEHGGGVAKVIARAAGDEFEKESKDYIRKHGYLRVGTCCTTTAGKLNYRCVIHTVGPNIKDYWPSQYSEMKSDLKKAVRVCFNEVEKRRLSSIGMTSISSGVYGVPKALCAETYAIAVQEYSSECGRNTSLKEIHFVDVNDDMVAEISRRFEVVFNSSTRRHDLEISHNKQPDKPTRQSQESINIKRIVHGSDDKVKYTEDYPKWYTDEEKWIFEFNKNMKVVVYTDNLTKFRMGAICCSQDTQLRSAGSIARAIKTSAGPHLDESLRKQRQNRIRIGDIIVTTSGNLRCSDVYHVVSPDFMTQNAQGVSNTFLSEVETGYIKCLQKAHERRLQKIAVPLFGCGVLSGCVDKLAKTFQSAVIKFCNDVSSKNTELREIHAINEKPGVTHKIKTGFLDYFEDIVLKGQVEGILKEGGIEQKKILNETHKSKESFQSAINKKDFKTPDKEYFDKEFQAAEISADETCSICLDSFINPKKLSRCGHIFCSECIEGQFRVAPKCPNCFMVYGIITGDQPEGNISVDIDRTTKLCGYKDCNTIVITYSFQGGVQGPNHPQPGKRYKGITRKGYLPDNAEGRLISEMLKVAFARKLVFTVGSSRTTGHEGVITWNDIHHKTDLRPNSAFGYPDPSYLDRIKDELATKGVTPDDVR